jgi:hypothetical protein
MSASPLSGWLPGVLSKAQVWTLCKSGWIEKYPIQKLVDASAIDLTLSSEGYRMLNGSIKPFGDDYYNSVLSDPKFAERLRPNNNGAFLIKARETVVFRLQQQISRVTPLVPDCDGKCYG